MDANGGDESEEDKAGNIDFDANADGDTDDGIWPAEFMVPTIVVAEPEMEMVVRGLRRRRWGVPLVPRSLLAPRLSCSNKKKNILAG